MFKVSRNFCNYICSVLRNELIKFLDIVRVSLKQIFLVLTPMTVHGLWYTSERMHSMSCTVDSSVNVIPVTGCKYMLYL